MYLEQIKSEHDIDFLKDGFLERIFPKDDLDYAIQTISLSLKKIPSESLFEELTYYFIKEGSGSKTIGIIGFYTSKENPKEVWLGWFGLLPEYHRKGIGTEALNALIKILHILKFNVLRVWTDSKANAEAIQFYLNRCFVQGPTYQNQYVTFQRGFLVPATNWYGKPFGFYGDI